MSRTIRLTESDLVNIVKNILSEQTTPAPATPRFKLPNGGTVTIKNTYGAGYYSMIHTDKAGNAFDNTKQIKPIITEATTFLKANKGSFIPKIIIRSGESIIPNSDVEGDGRALGRGQLSQKKSKHWLLTVRYLKFLLSYISLRRRKPPKYPLYVHQQILVHTLNG